MAEPNSATRGLRALAAQAVDTLLQADPVSATWLGDHHFDAELPEISTEAEAEIARRIDDHLTALDAIDDVELDVEDLVDLEILRARLMREQFNVSELQAVTWNPLLTNPGTALYLLINRDFAPIAERRAALDARIRAIPEYLATARQRLGSMPAIHVETAIAQFAGTRQLIETQIPAYLQEADAPPLASEALERAINGIDEHVAFLNDQLPTSNRSPRIGSRLYAGVLWHALDDASDAQVLLRQAEDHLDAVTTQLRELSAEYLDESVFAEDVVRRALGEVALRAPVTNESVLMLVEQALASTTQFVNEHELVSIPELDTRIIEMPEIHRGVAVAYCDAPGPMESVHLPTYVAVSPTPADWSAERMESFYREYNATLIHDLTIHEAMPGHVLQLAHAQRLKPQTPVRQFGFSGVFVEGWAVYAEELMVRSGYAPKETHKAHLAIQLQQLKMQARMAINTILDIRVHCTDFSEEEAMRLMLRRGFQEEGEATGKWRRALLTSGQLPTYFVGYQAVRSLAHDLQVLHPDWSLKQVHDLMLSHGSPAPRHLRTLIGV